MKLALLGAIFAASGLVSSACSPGSSGCDQLDVEDSCALLQVPHKEHSLAQGQRDQGDAAAEAAAPADYQTWEGKVKHRPTYPILPTNFTLIHIPKTAGTSLLKEAPNLIPIGSSLKGNEEQGWYHMNHPELKSQDHQLLVFLRNPIGHVLSLFLECKYDNFFVDKRRNSTGWPNGSLDSVYDGFQPWLSHFLEASQDHPADCFHCYDPRDMQTRYLSTRADHCAPTEPVDLELAKHNLDTVYLVGIQDLYTESLCLFRFYATGSVPPQCACDPDTQEIEGPVEEQIVETHGVPKHSPAELSEETLRLIAPMVKKDAELFLLGLHTFESKLRWAQTVTGVRLVCEERLNKVWSQARKLTSLVKKAYSQ